MMTRWEPGVRRESFIQGVKMANLCGENTTTDPFLSCGVYLSLKAEISALRLKMANLCGENTTTDPFLSCGVYLSLKARISVLRLSSGVFPTKVHHFRKNDPYYKNSKQG